MKTPSSLTRVALTAIALAVLAGTVGTTATQAADNGRGKENSRREERTVRQQKPERARKNDRSVRKEDRRREDRRDDRAVRGREGDRSVRGRDNDRDRDRDRDRIVIRDRDRRDDRGRYDRRHRVVVRHRDLRACPPPRYVVRPWYRDVRRIYVHDDPFYFHAGLGIYLGGLALRLELGDIPPAGFVFYDPYCDMEFWSVSEYRQHLRYHRHPNVLTVIVADGYYLDY